MKTTIPSLSIWLTCGAMAAICLSASAEVNTGASPSELPPPSVVKEDKEFLNELDGNSWRNPDPAAATASEESKAKATAPKREPKKVVAKTRKSSGGISTSKPKRSSEKVTVNKRSTSTRQTQVAVAEEPIREVKTPRRQITVLQETRTGPPLLSQREAEDFVDDYLASVEDDTEEESGFYADRVQYLDRGRVTRNVLLDERARLRSLWPDRRYDIETRPQVSYLGPDRAVVRFTKHFLLQNDREEVEGESDTLLHIGATPDGPKIVAIQAW